MKKLALAIAFAVFLFGFSVNNSHAGVFFDDFNDGNANGWLLNKTLHPHGLLGNWRVENGSLVQDTGTDGVLALLDGIEISTQTAEVQLKLNGPSGGGGLVIWFQDTSNFVYIVIANGRIEVAEVEDGVWISNPRDFDFSINENRWVDLRVEANAATGDLDIYADDNLLFVESINTTNRTGLSGLVHGNAGGYFDDFSLVSDLIFDSSINMGKCKSSGWQRFVNFIFRNQGECVSVIQSNRNSGK